MKLIYDSPASDDCDNPDNLTLTPRGGLLLCEDNAGSTAPRQFAGGERLVGLTFNGQAFTFAQNNIVNLNNYNDRCRPRRLPAERVGRSLLQPQRPMAVREHPDARYHLCHHRTVGRRVRFSPQRRRFMLRILHTCSVQHHPRVAASAAAAPISYGEILSPGLTVHDISTQVDFSTNDPLGANFYSFFAYQTVTVTVRVDRENGALNPAAWVYGGLFSDTSQFRLRRVVRRVGFELRRALRRRRIYPPCPALFAIPSDRSSLRSRGFTHLR